VVYGGAALSLVSALALPGGAGWAAASPHPATKTTAGDISTIAGGPGGPGLGTQIDLSVPCGLAAESGTVYIGDNEDVQQLTSAQGDLSVAAGTGFSGPFALGGPATSTGLDSVCSVAVDHHSDLVIVDHRNDLIEVVAHQTGTFYQQSMTAGDLYKVAGGGTSQRSGILATSFDLANLADVTVDAAGNLILTNGNRVYVIAEKTGTSYGQAMTAGHIYLLAGTGTKGYAGDGGPATSAELALPTGVTVDGSGNVVIGDQSNQRVRVVAAVTGMFYGQAMTAGNIYTVAGDGVMGYYGDGGPATSAHLHGPSSVAVDSSGNLVIADSGNDRIRVVAEKAGTFYGQAMTAGNIYTVAGKGQPGFTGNGGPATKAELHNPSQVAVDGSGNLVIADAFNSRIRVVAASAGTFYGQKMTADDIYTVAGTGHDWFDVNGQAATSSQILPDDTATDAAGDLAITDGGNQRLYFVPASTGTRFGQSMTAGHIYTIAGDGTEGDTGDGGPATKAELDNPASVAIDGSGNVVFAEPAAQRIQVVAAAAGTFYGQKMTAGDLYSIAGTGVKGYAGNGGPATAAQLDDPIGVGLDSSGNVLIADTANQVIRVVSVGSGTFYGQKMTAGDIYAVAGDGGQGYSGDGGPATQAELSYPHAVAAASSGNLVIDDIGNQRIRVVAEKTGMFYGQSMTAGNIYTIAGNGLAGYSGDGGLGTSAEVNDVGGVSVDSSGNVVIADSGNYRVRLVAVSAGTFYGQPMTAGDIYTVAGDGTTGFAGDAGPGPAAELASPEGVAVTAAGQLLIADTVNNRIRQLAG
jgi:hypothetical protein